MVTHPLTIPNCLRRLLPRSGVVSAGYVAALALGTATIALTDRTFGITDTTALTSGTQYNSVILQTYTGTLTASVTDYGLYNGTTITASDSQFAHTTYGMFGQTTLSNGYTTDVMYGLYAASVSNSTTISPDTPANTASTSAAIRGEAYNNSTGTITNQYGGLFSSFQNAASGTIGVSNGAYSRSYTNAGSITTASGANNNVFTMYCRDYGNTEIILFASDIDPTATILRKSSFNNIQS